MITDEQWMKLALQQAEKAAENGEVPVGAVIVRNGTPIAVGYNQRESRKNALCHAEICAIEQACQQCGGWRLEDCELYVTLEPCPMCAGAAINARLKRVVYGCADPKTGSCHSVTQLFTLPYPHQPECVGGVLEQPCAALLSAFFQKQRQLRQTAVKKGIIFYASALWKENRLFEGITEALTALHTQYPLYFIGEAGREYLVCQLDFHHLQHFFSEIQSVRYTKRTPSETLRLLMKRNHLTKAVCIGADEANRIAAQTAGLPFVHAAYTAGLAKSCQARVHTAEQFPAVIQSLWEPVG